MLCTCTVTCTRTRVVHRMCRGIGGPAGPAGGDWSASTSRVSRVVQSQYGFRCRTHSSTPPVTPQFSPLVRMIRVVSDSPAAIFMCPHVLVVLTSHERQGARSPRPNWSRDHLPSLPPRPACWGDPAPPPRSSHRLLSDGGSAARAARSPRSLWRRAS